jgi:hypothetical protein
MSFFKVYLGLYFFGGNLNFIDSDLEIFFYRFYIHHLNRIHSVG